MRVMIARGYHGGKAGNGSIELFLGLLAKFELFPAGTDSMNAAARIQSQKDKPAGQGSMLISRRTSVKTETKDRASEQRQNNSSNMPNYEQVHRHRE